MHEYTLLKFVHSWPWRLCFLLRGRYPPEGVLNRSIQVNLIIFRSDHYHKWFALERCESG